MIPDDADLATVTDAMAKALQALLSDCAQRGGWNDLLRDRAAQNRKDARAALDAYRFHRPA